MSKKTDKSLFIVSSVPRFYQVLLVGIESYKDLGNRIISDIKTAHAFRQVESVKQLAEVLINRPVKEYQLIGQYYLIWSQCRDLKYPIKELETIIDQTQTYKAKALSSRAAFEIYGGRPETALYFYTEALKASLTVSEYLHISRAIAVLKAQEGFHRSAVRDLEKVIPFMRHAEPLVYYDVLNSYAIELGEIGRKYEARNIIRHVIASPLAFAYPEWRETAEELQSPNRSFAVLKPARRRKTKILSMPVIEHAESVIQDKPARVLSLQEWKKKMGKDDTEKLNEKQMVVKMMTMLTSESVTYDQLCKIMAYIHKITSEPDKSEPDEE
jgi:hypothetical protein